MVWFTICTHILSATSSNMVLVEYVDLSAILEQNSSLLDEKPEIKQVSNYQTGKLT